MYALPSPQVSPNTSLRRIEILRQQLAQLEAAQAAAQAEYERQAARNSQELSAFRAQRSTEVASTMVAIATVQARWQERLAQAWEDVARKLPAEAHVTAGLAQRDFKLAAP